MNIQNSEIVTLTDTLIFELTKAFALPQTERARSIVRFFFGKAARSAAEVGIGLDRAVEEGGVCAGARWILPRFVKSYEARGRENIPLTGPLVIASNHPAFVDSVVISAYVDRPDFKVIIGNIPFFKNLPHLSRHAIFAPEKSDAVGRMQVIRDSIRHLQKGGALLIFPRGGIEPDPECMSRPDREFNHWSRSLEIFMQRVPDLQILVTIASGVISRSAVRHPITWLRRARPDRQRLAFLYQFVCQILSGRQIFDLTPRVTFGEILSGKNHDHMLAEIEQAAHRTLDRHMTWSHV